MRVEAGLHKISYKLPHDKKLKFCSSSCNYFRALESSY